MLNFEFIENCSCSPTLQRIIRLLSESKNKSPQLMKAAMKRLTMVQQQDVILTSTNNSQISSPTPHLIKKLTNTDEKRDSLHPNKGEGLAANLSRITTSNTTLDSIDPGKASLNFSLSPSSTLHGIDLIENSQTPESKFFDSGRKSMSRRLGPIVESPVALKARLHKLSNTSHHSHQREQSTQLSPSRNSASVSFAAQQIQNFKKNLDETSSDKKALLIEIRKVTKEHEETKRALDLTRATLCKKDEETRAIEERLELRITELSQVLAGTAAQSKLVVEGERTYRKQCEEELLKENKKNAHLNQELKETRVNLEILQRRHSSFRVELLKVTGISKTERKSLSQREFLSSLSKKIETMKNDNDRMAQTLKQANNAIQQRDVMEMRMNDALQMKEKLKIENKELSGKIQELRAEVKSSRAYIDKLLRTSHESKEEDWEKHEQQYKQVIQNLRKQILKQDAVISIDLYRAEKDIVREKTTQLRVAEGTIDGLNTKLAELQNEKEMFSNSKRSPSGVNEIFADKQNTQMPKNNRKGIRTPTTKFQSLSKLYDVGTDKSKDDLTGITITFQSPESNNTSRQRTRSPRTGEMYQRKIGVKQAKITGTMKENKASVLGGITLNSNQNNQMSHPTNHHNELKKKSSKVNDFDNYFAANYGKENSIAPKNLSRESPLQLVRDLGGRSALKSKIKKMRSPKMSKAPVMSRQVQVILH